MQIGKFRIGLRTLKSSLAVMVCILLFHFTTGEKPMIAAVSAVFALRQDLTTSVSFGKSRIIGNSLGGGLALIYFYIKSFFHNDFIIELLVVPLMVALCIAISNGINNNSGIVSSVATLLLIALSIPQGESVLYVVTRVIETFIGTFVAIALNFFAQPKAQEQQAEIAEDLDTLAKKEAALKEQLLAVQNEIEKHQEKP